jgi:hypothetical protein
MDGYLDGSTNLRRSAAKDTSRQTKVAALWKEIRMQPRHYLLAVALGVLTLTGCAGSDALSPEDVARAAIVTGETNSTRMSIEMEFTLPGSDESSMVSGEGAFDNVNQRGVMTMDLGSLAVAAEQNLGTTTTVIDGTQMYMKMPFVETATPQLKPWIKIDLQEAGKEQGIDIGSLLELGRGGDPSEALTYLRATGEVEQVGAEDVRGVATTHYSAVVDLERVPDLAPEESRERIRAAIEQLIKLTGKSTQPTDVWIDGEGLVRRMSIEQTVEQGSEASKTTTTIELYDFNSEVTIEVPPADQVSDLRELVSQRD